MSLQTSLDSYFKSKANAGLVGPNNMVNKTKFKRRSLSLTRSPRPNKSPKNIGMQISGLKTEPEIICLADSSPDFLTPPERRGYDNHSSSKSGESSIPRIMKQDSIQLTNDLSSLDSSSDSSSTIIYSLSPEIIRQSPRTPSKTSQSPRSNKKFYSPTKKRLVQKRTPVKRNLAFNFRENENHQNSSQNKLVDPISNSYYQDDKTWFLLSIIDEYMNNDALKDLLDEESQVLLSNCMKVEEPGMRVVCRLYWRKPGWYQTEQLEQIASEKNKISSPNMFEMIQSLLDKGLITSAHGGASSSMEFDDYIKLLKRPELQQICKELKLKIQSKQDAVDALRKFSQSSAISNYFTGKGGSNSGRVLKILRSKTGQCYKLTDVARNTLYKLYVLMYLGIDYTIIREKRLELILIHDKRNKETYPVDKNMVLDNASVVFQTKEEFNRYLEAHVMYENYITSIETKEKCDIVLQAYRLYKEVSEQEMLSYKSLPPWLRRFTPANVYVKILESGVHELKKDKAEDQYRVAVEILTTLLAQVAFRQHKRANWYAEKALILHKHLDCSTQAAKTLLEGFKEDLSEEAKDTLRPRAKLIANQRNVTLDDELRRALRDHAEQQHILECNLPADHVYKQPMDNHNQRGKLKFEAHTGEGRATLTAEHYCVLHYTLNGDFTHGEHCEGRIVTTIFFLLFWDIIYKKLVGIGGIFMSHYQQLPLDMYSEHFYINRKRLIDDRLTFIEESTDDMVVEMMESRWQERPEHEVSVIYRSVEWEVYASVARCLGARAVAAICRRLARNYGYTHSGFPDLTLWNVHTRQIKFVEVKTDADKPSMKQLQWLQYLRSHNIAAGFCYVGVNTTRSKARPPDSDSLS